MTSPRDAEAVLELVAAQYGVTRDDMIRKTRVERITWARHVTCWLLRRAGWSSTRVGAEIGRDHCAVLNSERAVEDYRSVYPQIRSETDGLLRLLMPQNHCSL